MAVRHRGREGGRGRLPADWNWTHLFNPAEPPHARIYDAWTILLGLALGTGGLYVLREEDAEPGLRPRLATLLPAACWAAQASGYAFPGTGGLGAEFPDEVPDVAGGHVDEWASSGLMLLPIGTGRMFQRRRISASPGCIPACCLRCRGPRSSRR